MNNKRITGVLSGVAGEYLVAGELSRRGYIASITLRNTKGVDILASNATASRTVAIQVKTNQGNPKFWLLDKKVEDYHADNLFYVFVNLNNGKAPDYFIAPSKIVADFAKKYHKKWISTPGRKGQQRKDTPLREFRDPKKEYLNKWELLGL